MKTCCRCKKAAVVRQRMSVPGDKGRWKDYCDDHRRSADELFEACPPDAPPGWESTFSQQRYEVTA